MVVWLKMHNNSKKTKNFSHKATKNYFCTCFNTETIQQNVTEKELKLIVEACRRNERHAQNVLYNKLYGFAHSICRRYAHNESEIVDLVQDGFFKVFMKMDYYSDELSFYAWFKKVFINTCIDHHRQYLREVPTEELTPAADKPFNGDVLIHIDADHLLYLVQSLPAAYRTVFNLYAIEGYGYQEIADILHVSIGTVKSNIFKARERLKLAINPINTSHNYER
jgi:RNA polymerase sigma-70 factor (ECF subfamily)